MTDKFMAQLLDQLINKLSKVDQRNIKIAIMHADHGNYRALDSMVRAANNRSESTLRAIRAAL